MSPKAIPDQATLPDLLFFLFYLALIVSQHVFHSVLFGCVLLFFFSMPGAQFIRMFRIYSGKKKEPKPKFLLREEKGTQTQTFWSGYLPAG